MLVRPFTLAALLASPGCYHGLDAAAAHDASSDDHGSDGSGSGSDGGSPAEVCGAAATVGVTALRRLTRGEYDATIRDLFGAAPIATAFVPDELHGGFASNTALISDLQVDQYRQAAVALATEVVDTRLAELLPCAHDDEGCVAPFVARIGERILRRPLTDEELEEYVGLWREGSERWDADRGIELVLEAMLMSPHFVYHVEVGRSDAEGSMIPLTGFEVAARLSYALWGTMPDDPLFAAARAGVLDDPDGVEAQARRMLVDPRAGEMLDTFTQQWLELDGLVAANREGDPRWSEDLRAAMLHETRTFVREVVLAGDGRLETLLAAPYSYVGPELAALYGVESSDDPLGRVELPPDERAGVLTQAAFLVGKTAPDDDWTKAAIHSGKFVRRRLLCGVLPPPPAMATFDPTVPRLERDECRGCHLLMDPIGNAFAAYDPLGVHRTVDADGVPIVPGGEVVGSPIGTFASVVDLAHALSTSDEVRACTTRTFGYATLARDLADPADACSHTAITEAFAASDFDVRELLIAIVRSDAFRHLPRGS